MASSIRALCLGICCTLILTITCRVSAETRISSLVQGAAPSDTIVTGAGFACALMTDGRVSCWGSNGRGQLGRDSSITFSPQPAPVVALDQVVSLAAGGEHACALRQNGSVWCWGNNESGQLGDGTNKDRPLPVQAAFPSQTNSPRTGMVRLTAGKAHSCAADSSYQAYCWGDNSSGQLGIDPRVPSSNTPIWVDISGSSTDRGVDQVGPTRSMV